jgi:UDP-N-acetylmuramoyl-tripeptide--D-alanyl-D-alanine ligase
MLPWTLAQIATAVGGTVRDADPNALVTGLATFDSRNVEPGGLFVALGGARVDGHDFAAQAVAAGAVGVLASRPVGVPAILVADVQDAYTRLATALVEGVPGLTVVGITGSAGKTTTKDLIGQLLSRLGPTVAPPGNRNSEVGVPETVSRLIADTRFLVLEMGARHVGDIAYLAGMVHLTVGVVLNVGTAHLGEFGSREAIAKAKGEIVEALGPRGVAVLNADDPLVAAMASRTLATVVSFGRTQNAAVRADNVSVDDAGRAAFILGTPHGRTRVQLRLHGEHLVPNALAAAAVALTFTDDVDLIGAALSAAAPVSPGRMHVTHRPDGITIVNDAYNANPASTLAALTALTTMAAGQRTIAVLGQMNELGDGAPAEHTRIGEATAAAGVDLQVAVGGSNAAHLASAAARAGIQAVHVPDRHAAERAVTSQLTAGDIVLVKGSNSLGLMALADHLARG